MYSPEKDARARELWNCATMERYNHRERQSPASALTQRNQQIVAG